MGQRAGTTTIQNKTMQSNYNILWTTLFKELVSLICIFFLIEKTIKKNIQLDTSVNLGDIFSQFPKVSNVFPMHRILLRYLFSLPRRLVFFWHLHSIHSFRVSRLVPSSSGQVNSNNWFLSHCVVMDSIQRSAIGSSHNKRYIKNTYRFPLDLLVFFYFSAPILLTFILFVLSKHIPNDSSTAGSSPAPPQSPPSPILSPFRLSEFPLRSQYSRPPIPTKSNFPSINTYIPLHFSRQNRSIPRRPLLSATSAPPSDVASPDPDTSVNKNEDTFVSR